jgi:hypothetical protein
MLRRLRCIAQAARWLAPLNGARSKGSWRTNRQSRLAADRGKRLLGSAVGFGVGRSRMDLLGALNVGHHAVDRGSSVDRRAMPDDDCVVAFTGGALLKPKNETAIWNRRIAPRARVTLARMVNAALFLSAHSSMTQSGGAGAQAAFGSHRVARPSLIHKN